MNIAQFAFLLFKFKLFDKLATSFKKLSTKSRIQSLKLLFRAIFSASHMNILNKKKTFKILLWNILYQILPVYQFYQRYKIDIQHRGSRNSSSGTLLLTLNILVSFAFQVSISNPVLLQQIFNGAGRLRQQR